MAKSQKVVTTEEPSAQLESFVTEFNPLVGKLILSCRSALRKRLPSAIEHWHGIDPKQRISLELGQHLIANPWLNKSKVVDHSYTKPQSAFGSGLQKSAPLYQLGRR